MMILKKLIKRFCALFMSPLQNRLDALESKHDHLLLLSAQLLLENRLKVAEDLPLSTYEFKVWSQHGQDGIIQHLIRRFEVPFDTFVEFGASDYKESNTRCLLTMSNWRGLIMDGSESNIRAIEGMDLYWRRDLRCKQAFITAENINELISSAGFSGPIGLLSVDIDGNDYWVWKSLTTVQPAIVICEFNPVFGSSRSVTIPYKPDFDRTRAHPSNLYFGVSLPALLHLADEKGYIYIGRTETGNDAFFIEKNLAHRHGLSQHAPVTLDTIRFTESRDASGQLNFLRGEESFQQIAHLPLVDITD